MKSLYENISSLSVEDDFELHFKILNISRGWKLASKLTCDRLTINKLIRYIAYAYSYDSLLLRKKKDRFENKMNIVSVLEIECNEYVLDCIHNKNATFNQLISWYLRENLDRDFAVVISGEELLFDLLQTARDGVEKTVTAKDEKQAERVMKTFIRIEVIAKAEAYERAIKLRASLESQSRDLEKKYEYLAKVVKEDSPEIAGNMNWAELMVLRNRQKK